MKLMFTKNLQITICSLTRLRINAYCIWIASRLNLRPAFEGKDDLLVLHHGDVVDKAAPKVLVKLGDHAVKACRPVDEVIKRKLRSWCAFCLRVHDVCKLCTDQGIQGQRWRDYSS